MSTACDTRELISPDRPEYSIKVSRGGLNNNRMIKSFEKYDPEILKYAKRVEGGLSLLMDHKHDRAMYGIDGKSKAQKVYAENENGTIYALEQKDGVCSRRCYYRLTKPNPKIKVRSDYYPQVLCYVTDEHFNPIRLKTTHLSVFKDIKDCIPVLLGLARRHAGKHYDDLVAWLDVEREDETLLTWLGLSDQSFTIYYMNKNL